jgi:hypothetical protein
MLWRWFLPSTRLATRLPCAGRPRLVEATACPKHDSRERAQRTHPGLRLDHARGLARLQRQLQQRDLLAVLVGGNHILGRPEVRRGREALHLEVEVRGPRVGRLGEPLGQRRLERGVVGVPEKLRRAHAKLGDELGAGLLEDGKLEEASLGLRQHEVREHPVRVDVEVTVVRVVKLGRCGQEGKHSGSVLEVLVRRGQALRSRTMSAVTPACRAARPAWRWRRRWWQRQRPHTC